MAWLLSTLKQFGKIVVKPHRSPYSLIYEIVIKHQSSYLSLPYLMLTKISVDFKASEAIQHVFGYTAAHDVSARDWMKKNMKQVMLGKCIDTFCPLGPAIVTTDGLSGKKYQFYPICINIARIKYWSN